jgi:hypothetical protein
MSMTKTWKVAVTLTEDAGRTRAEAHLHGAGAVDPTGGELRGVGLARCHPADADVPAIGDEVAVSRALSELSHRLLDVAAHAIEAHTGERKVHVNA